MSSSARRKMLPIFWAFRRIRSRVLRADEGIGPYEEKRYRAGQGKNDDRSGSSRPGSGPCPADRPGGRPLRRETIPSGSGKERPQTRFVTTWLPALPARAAQGRNDYTYLAHDLAVRPADQLHRNLTISHFFSSHFTGIIRSNDSNKSFSFSSPLFCCRVPAARQRVFCRFLGAIPKTA